jgi:hypothetical protein
LPIGNEAACIPAPHGDNYMNYLVLNYGSMHQSACWNLKFQRSKLGYVKS